MSSPKTIPGEFNVEDFLSTVDQRRQTEAHTLIKIMSEVSGMPPVMWGASIIGFGSAHYAYDSGREGDWPVIAFSPRKAKISLYLTNDATKYQTELDAMGKHSIGKGCIYVNRLTDVSEDKLRDLIKLAYKEWE